MNKILLLLCFLSFTYCKKKSSILSLDITKVNIVVVTDEEEIAEYIKTDRLKNTVPIEMDDNLVKIDPKEYDIDIDIRYAKDTNFTCTTKGLKCFKGYKYEFLYLHKDAAKRLKLASEMAKKMGYKIIVWDGWRPYEAQEAFYQFVLDDRYFSSPTKIAAHTRGIAIDLGLKYRKTGKLLDFGTDFDSFHEHSNQFLDKGDILCTPNLTDKQSFNRNILSGIMNRVGMTSLSSEWWHFYLVDPIYGVTKYPKYKAGKRKEEFVNDAPITTEKEIINEIKNIKG